MFSSNLLVLNSLPGDPQPSDSGLPFHCSRRSPHAPLMLTEPCRDDLGAILRRRWQMSERIPARAEVGGLTEILLSHLDSAYNLAHWLVRNGDDADDVVQEAYLRAFQYSDRFRGGDARAW